MNGGELFVEHQTLRRFIAVAIEIVRGNTDVATKLSQLRAPFGALLSDPEWLPDNFKQPAASTTMGYGVASLLLYRSEPKDLSLSTLVVAPFGIDRIGSQRLAQPIQFERGDREEGTEVWIYHKGTKNTEI
jgi:predicted metal-dependent enzyme (double-stranded beta helix superfamily)